MHAPIGVATIPGLCVCYGAGAAYTCTLYICQDGLGNLALSQQNHTSMHQQFLTPTCTNEECAPKAVIFFRNIDKDVPITIVPVS